LVGSSAKLRSAINMARYGDLRSRSNCISRSETILGHPEFISYLVISLPGESIFKATLKNRLINIAAGKD